jgi:hypothetical protein
MGRRMGCYTIGRPYSGISFSEGSNFSDIFLPITSTGLPYFKFKFNLSLAEKLAFKLLHRDHYDLNRQQLCQMSASEFEDRTAASR